MDSLVFMIVPVQISAPVQCCHYQSQHLEAQVAFQAY